MIDLNMVIPNGKENAIHLSELSEVLGVATQTVKKAIRKAREKGEPIISGTEGYWYTDSIEEKQKFVDRERKSAITRLTTIKAINNSLKENNALKSDLKRYKE